MFRTIALAFVALLGLATFTGTASAQYPYPYPQPRPQPFPGGCDHFCSQYQVFVRHGCHWDLEGTFGSSFEAYRYAERLQRRGFDTRVQQVRR